MGGKPLANSTVEVQDPIGRKSGPQSICSKALFQTYVVLHLASASGQGAFPPWGHGFHSNIAN